MDYTGCTQTTADGNQVMTLGCFPTLIKYLINFGFGAVGVTALIFIIISGVKLTRSNGDPKQAEGARQTMTFAIIGLIIVLFSAWIVNFIGTVTGVTCITILQQDFGNCQ